MRPCAFAICTSQCSIQKLREKQGLEGVFTLGWEKNEKNWKKVAQIQIKAITLRLNSNATSSKILFLGKMAMLRCSTWEAWIHQGDRRPRPVNLRGIRTQNPHQIHSRNGSSGKRKAHSRGWMPGKATSANNVCAAWHADTAKAGFWYGEGCLWGGLLSHIYRTSQMSTANENPIFKSNLLLKGYQNINLCFNTAVFIFLQRIHPRGKTLPRNYKCHIWNHLYR